MADSFTLEELTNYDKGFQPPAAVAAETPVTPPVEPETGSPPEPESDVVVQADSTPPAADEPAPEAPPKGSARERIEELVAERNALKKFIDYREAAWSQPGKVETPAPVAEISTAPTLESCQYDTDKWTQAMSAYTQKQIQAGVKQALESERNTASVQDTRAKFEQRMDAFAKATPDVKVVLGNPALPQLDKDAAALVVKSDLGPQIMYHLGKNPEKAARIARQSPIEQGAAIGRIEAELKLPKPQKQISNAPEPPTPSKGAIAPQEGGSIADFVARERKAMADRRRRP